MLHSGVVRTESGTLIDQYSMRPTPAPSPSPPRMVRVETSVFENRNQRVGGDIPNAQLHGLSTPTSSPSQGRLSLPPLTPSNDGTSDEVHEHVEVSRIPSTCPITFDIDKISDRQNSTSQPRGAIPNRIVHSQIWMTHAADLSVTRSRRGT